ncbi:hypothetical protein [Winogradskyella sp.]|nr:hypothetical protein [Winogradskyella sp.]
MRTTVQAMIMLLLDSFVPMAVPTIGSSFGGGTFDGETKLAKLS